MCVCVCVCVCVFIIFVLSVCVPASYVKSLPSLKTFGAISFHSSTVASYNDMLVVTDGL